MSRIFITGDTHADYDWKKLMTKSFPVQKELTKDDYVIIAGDFGGVFLLDRTDKYIQKNYNERNFPPCLLMEITRITMPLMHTL